MTYEERWAEGLAGTADKKSSSGTNDPFDSAIEGLDGNTPQHAIDDLCWLADLGAKFALPFGRSKKDFPKNWQNTPHTIEEAIDHALGNENVGILTGKHSGGIVALDRDVHFPETCEALGGLAKTVKIGRDNAPDRGKFLYRIVGGDIPPSTSWKPEGAKSPEVEFLADGRHALGPTSVFSFGRYVLIDKECGIQELNLIELDYIWRFLTGGSIYKDVRAQEEEEAAKQAKDEYIKQVFEHWTTGKIFKHFNKCDKGTKKEGKETRILGNGGLLIGKNNEQWSIPAEKIGGGPLQAWTYCRWNKILKPTGKEFWDVINDMGDTAGIARPKATTNTTKSSTTTKQVSAPQNESRVTWKDYTDAFNALNFHVRMNDLDDTIEVNGEKLSDGIEAEILMRMADAGFNKAEWVKRAYTANAHQNRYHPVKVFLNSLQWDGKDWIAEFERYVWDNHPRIQYADGSVMPVFGAWLRRWGVGAVAKVQKTGPVRGQNTVITLAGGQNIGKSTLARFLCPMDDNYFIESHIDPNSNDHIRYLATRLCWEVAELGATTRKADREALKSFLTRQDCTFRTPYAHHPVTKPALTSFIGTINPENGFLNDPTGHRRFLPVEIKKIDFAYIKAIDPKQLWAQFVALFNAGESAALTPEESKMADAIRNQHETEDAYTGFILKYYDIDHDQPRWVETTTDIVDQLAINGVSGVNVTNVGLSLKRLGLERYRETTGQKRTLWSGITRNSFGDKVRR